MAEDVKPEVETEENTTGPEEEVQVTEEVKTNVKSLKDKIDEVKIIIKEQGEKTATKKDVWKAALTNATIVIGTIVIGAVFGV